MDWYDTSAIQAEIAELEREIEVVEGLARQAIQNNAREIVDQSEWMERNGVYLNRHAEVTKRLEELDRQKVERVGRGKTIAVFIQKLEHSERMLAEFDCHSFTTGRILSVIRLIVLSDTLTP